MNKKLGILGLVLVIGVGSALIYADKPIKLKSENEEIERSNTIEFNTEYEGEKRLSLKENSKRDSTEYKEDNIEYEESNRVDSINTNRSINDKDIEKWQQNKLERRKKELERRRERLQKEVEKGNITEEEVDKWTEDHEKSIEYQEEYGFGRRKHHDYNHDNNHKNHHKEGHR